jgi:fatty acid-binding protein DegV
MNEQQEKELSALVAKHAAEIQGIVGKPMLRDDLLTLLRRHEKDTSELLESDNHPGSLGRLRRSAAALARAGRSHAEVVRSLSQISQVTEAEQIAERFESIAKQY